MDFYAFIIVVFKCVCVGGGEFIHTTCLQMPLRAGEGLDPLALELQVVVNCQTKPRSAADALPLSNSSVSNVTSEAYFITVKMSRTFNT